MMFVFPLLGVIMPVLAVVTLVSNTIIIVILSRPGMRSPTNCVLLSMAVCDLCTILIPTPWSVVTVLQVPSISFLAPPIAQEATLSVRPCVCEIVEIFTQYS